jgi:transcriptional regulator GlxA family with amidase domain
MSATRRVWVTVFPGFQSLDAFGPIEVFAGANQALERRLGSPGYTVELVAPVAGPVRSSSGVEVVAARGFGPVRAEIDLLLVAGGVGTREAATSLEVSRFVGRAAARARRVASVCTGAYLLAEAGLLDGRRATTHWAQLDHFAARFPEVDVERNAIYVQDGQVSTSAGVTSGIDLALALVAEDYGRKLSLMVARYLVMFMHRPGGQAQFSEPLRLQSSLDDRLADLQAFVLEHLDEPLDVETLARRAGMSPRHFARVFRERSGITPGAYVEQMRIETARGLLEQTELDVQAVADSAGFGSVATLRRAFARRLKVSPSAYRTRFRAV